MVGNLPKFSSYDVLRVFLRIKNDIARAGIVKETGLGEGTVRTILDILKQKRLIGSDRQGHSVTTAGENVLKAIKEEFDFQEIENIKEVGGKKTIAFRIRSDGKTTLGVEQRDIAIKNGAESALLMFYDRSRLKMPGYQQYATQQFEALWKYEQNDVLVVVSSNSTQGAEWAGIAVAESINAKLKKILENISQ